MIPWHAQRCPTQSRFLFLLGSTLIFFEMISAAIGWTPLVRGQDINRMEIPSSVNPVGSGARALGMSGAFIAVADDATAASWNPGALIQLENSEVAIVGAACNRRENNSFHSNPEASGPQSTTTYKLNYFSGVYAFTVAGRNMIGAISYQHLYDFTRNWEFQRASSAISNGSAISNSSADSNSSAGSYFEKVKFSQEGALSAIGISYCFQATPRFSFGITLNTWSDNIANSHWNQRAHQEISGALGDVEFSIDSTNTNQFSFRGVNANLGILWHPNKRLALGAVLKTPFKAHITKNSHLIARIHYPDEPQADTSTFATTVEEETLDMPISYGLGAALRFSDAFTLSLDVQRTHWDDLVLTDSHGNQTSFITASPVSESNIEPATQVRLGAEYLLIAPTFAIPVRSGFFYDPAPAPGGSDDFWGFSLGSGIANSRLAFDVAYQYRLGKNVNSATFKPLNLSQDISEHTVYSSLIVYF